MILHLLFPISFHFFGLFYFSLVFSVMLAMPALVERPDERVASESGERDSVDKSYVGGAGGCYGSGVSAGGRYGRGCPANRFGGGLGAGGRYRGGGRYSGSAAGNLLVGDGDR
jgi:hypothetical protein